MQYRQHRGDWGCKRAVHTGKVLRSVCEYLYVCERRPPICDAVVSDNVIYARHGRTAGRGPARTNYRRTGHKLNASLCLARLSASVAPSLSCVCVQLRLLANRRCIRSHSTQTHTHAHPCTGALSCELGASSSRRRIWSTAICANDCVCIWSCKCCAPACSCECANGMICVHG